MPGCYGRRPFDFSCGGDGAPPSPEMTSSWRALAASSHPDMTDANPPADLCDDLARLVYELLDAHYDTARLAEDVAEDERWHTHLSYLRDLQRIAREVLATASAEAEAWPSRASARR
jgi:hypothetical protein